MSVDREARRLYIGNVAPGATGHIILQILNSVMIQSGYGTPAALPVKDVQSNGSFAFAEFVTPEFATAALAFDGLNCMGTSLKLKRPSAYVAPASGAGAATPSLLASLPSLPPMHGILPSASKLHISGFPSDMTEADVKALVAKSGMLASFAWAGDYALFEYVNPMVTDRVIQSLHGMPLGADNTILSVRKLDEVAAEKAAADANGGVAPTKKAIVSAPVNPDPTTEGSISKVLQAAHQIALKAVADVGGLPAALKAGRSNCLKLMNLITAADVKDPFEFDDIVDDIREECNLLGPVVDVKIKKPPLDTRPLPEDPIKLELRKEEDAQRERRTLVDVYVQFESEDGAQAALLGLVGRKFKLRVVTGTFVTAEAMAAAFTEDVDPA